ncbi:OHCU decarboxylase [Niallia circulans]|uniref:2-oxo-4-hydroxy-4-carboxy-5-ureidoimidazoline decarboxylase n=1 Tax=Niallia circulans TaxID=1397 RepID=A0AA91TWH5_NIACI|nr:2-oxo-4-hydroxy-4-carboxy-5-ureidoimidazoline decarboxylase [Niallia circulans]PAD84852.1 OHCU decarboxylase [Niallia circulans]
MYTIAEINQMNRQEFIEKIGWVFEHSPWIANKTWNYRPFPSLNTLYQLMVQVVMEAPIGDQLDLIREHPDLGGKLKMTSSSSKEQKGAGLNQLSEQEYMQFAALNKTYSEKFGFPFILAVKGHTKDSVYQSMKERVNHTKEEEFQTALTEIFSISKFRLEEIVKLETEGQGA